MDNTSVRHTAHLGFEQHNVKAWVETGKIRLKINDGLLITMGESDAEDLAAIILAAVADKARA